MYNVQQAWSVDVEVTVAFIYLTLSDSYFGSNSECSILFVVPF